MTPQQIHRRAQMWLAVGALAVCCLVLSVWLVGEKATGDLRRSEANARAEQRTEALTALHRQNQSLRAGCARAVARDFESLGTNQDLRDFARDAAKARRADGNEGIARRYEARADSAEFRMRRIRLRVPAGEDEASVVAFCRELYPEPTPAADK